MNTLQGKTALVTGAASGIGRASALLFASEGAAVVALDLAPKSRPRRRRFGRPAGARGARLRMLRPKATWRAPCPSRSGNMAALDVCYANAGISGGLGAVLRGDGGHWKQVLQVNLIGAFLAAKHAALAMVPRRRGSIICTASVAGLRSAPAACPTAPARPASSAWCRRRPTSCAGTGVRVNAICPGLIETGMTRPIFEQARARGSDRKIGQLNPLRRAGSSRGDRARWRCFWPPTQRPT